MHILMEHKIKYLKRRIQEINELRTSLENNNFSVALSIGHKLKGNGETFGFPIISKIGLSIEKAAQAEDSDILRSSVEELSSFVNEQLELENK